jgi:sorting and assembly machinery component 37
MFCNLLQIAWGTFLLLQRKVGSFCVYFNNYVMKNARPSTLDVVVASHIMLLLNAPFPDALISNLLVESYPTLVIHARLVLFRAFPFPSSTPPSRKADFSWQSLIPRPRFEPAREPSPTETRFAYMRYGWFALAVVSSAAYWWMNPLFGPGSPFVLVKRVEDLPEAEGEDAADEREEDVEED